MVLALLATLALAGGEQADERFCQRRPALPRPSRMEEYQAARRSFGFRSDKAYIRRLLRRGVRVPVWGFPGIDWEAAEADGFHLATTSSDIDTSTVEIELVTRRTDHREYFRERYGLHVTTRVIATELTSPECAPLFGYVPGSDPSSLTVRYEAGGGAQFERAEVLETDTRVEIGIVVQAPNGPRTAESRPTDQTVALSRPLGDRRVVNARTGRALRRLQ